MITLKDAVPCKICGEKPILQGGKRSGRLACPNYKSEQIPHGNMDADAKDLPKGFTDWCYHF